MTITSFTFMFAALVAITSLSACSDPSGGGGGGDTPRWVAKDGERCDVTPVEGPDAVIANNGKTELVNSSFFGKPYDRYDLEAVLNASSFSTTKYVSSLGINVQKVPIAKVAGKCATYFNLPEYSKPNQEIWADQLKGAPPGMSLAGLYFELCGMAEQPSCSDRDLVQPTILVDEVSDRWTLVHEMMHHNFNQGRKLTRTMASTNAVNRLVNRYEAGILKIKETYEKDPNQGDLAELAKQIDGYMKAAFDLATRGPLEEIAVEGMLVDLWSQDQLRNVSKHAAASAIMYMGVSQKRALGQINVFVKVIGGVEQEYELQKLMQGVKDESETRFWPDVADQIAKTKLAYEAMAKDINDKVVTAKASVEAKAGPLEPTENQRWVGFSSGAESLVSDAIAAQNHVAHLEDTPEYRNLKRSLEAVAGQMANFGQR